MIWPWKKSGRDVIDLTKMRHLIPSDSESFQSDIEIVDLSNNAGKQETASPLSALGNLANAARAEEGYLRDSPGPITSGLREARDARKEKLRAVFNEMRVKVDDNDYKLTDLMSKMRDMEKRLKEIERRR